MMKFILGIGLIMALAGCVGVETAVTVPAPTATAVPIISPSTLPAPTPAASTSTTMPTATTIPTATSEPTSTPESEDSPMNQANADVLFVRALQTAAETWTFHVTVAHPDSGWEDYADGWDVVLPDGTVVLPNPDNPFTRLLLHPHETEQPFTRSQSGIQIPASVTAVTVRAHDLVDGFGGQEVLVDLTAVSGTNFEVEKQ